MKIDMLKLQFPEPLEISLKTLHVKFEEHLKVPSMKVLKIYK